jgi:hypothetical protein
MDFPEIGLREWIQIAIAMAAVYLVAALLRLMRLKRRGPQAPAPVKEPPREAKPSRRSQWLQRLKRVKDSKEAEEPGPELPPVARRTSTFGEELFRSGVENELQQMRGEVAALKEELKLMKAARRVSPQYNEAMMLAQRGMSAQSVADQCGISVGEAELVLALSRNKQEYENHGDNEPPRSARS